MLRSTFVLPLTLLACSTHTPVQADAPPEVVELAGYKTAATWPDVDRRIVVGLIARFNALGRADEAQSFFAERAAATVGQPAHPWMRAAEGLFQIQNNRSVALTSRMGFVREGVSKLDEAVAEEPGLARYLRGVALVRLPASFNETERGVEDLQWVLDQGDVFPDSVRRGALRELATGLQSLDRIDEAADAMLRSGHRDEGPTFATSFQVDGTDGFTFARPNVRTVAQGVHVAEGFDFGDIGFIETPEGMVVVDAGTFVDNAQAAWSAFAGDTQPTVHTLVLTHAHWDHIGGAAAFIQPGVDVWAESHFMEELSAVERVDPPPFRWFFGERDIDLSIQPTRIVAEPTDLGLSRPIEVIPVQGGETHDALLVHVPDAGIVFTGDVFMPYLGAPFVEEGDPVQLLDAIDTILELEPTRLIHGHKPLTENWTIEALPGLRAGLAELIDHTLTSLQGGESVQSVMRDNLVPDVLMESPQAVLPYLVMREGVIKRLYDLNTGYWQPDRSGVDVLDKADWARAFSAAGLNDDSDYARAAERLLEQGEAILPLELVETGLIDHPNSQTLLDLRQQCLQRARAFHATSNPFKFIVYSEEADQALGPLIVP